MTKLVPFVLVKAQRGADEKEKGKRGTIPEEIRREFDFGVVRPQAQGL